MRPTMRCVLCLLALVAVAYGQVAPVTPTAAPSAPKVPKLTNADIVALKQAGLGDDLIILKIKASGVDYKLQADDLIELKKVGVSANVMAFMIQASAIQASATSSKPVDATPTMPICVPSASIGDTSNGQQIRPQFTLGMTVDELHSSFGMPTAYYNSSTKQTFTSEKEAQIARQVSGDPIVGDMYEIKTAANTYLFTAVYFGDTRQSRLRPTRRLVWVSFELDKPVEDIRSLLADLPEAVTFCSQECGIYITDDFEIVPHLFVQHTNSSAEEIREAGLIAVSWGEGAPKEPWVKSFEFNLKGKRIESGRFEINHKGRYYSKPLTLTGVWQSCLKRQ